MLNIGNLVCRIGDKTIVDGISISFAAGLLHVIVGPNGSGKSTFLKAFSGEWTPASGHVTYDGAGLDRYERIGLARRRAVMTQLPELHFPLSVDEIVMMGRYPHFSFRPTANDKAICEEAKRLLSIDGLGDRDYLTLSGGERQRVQFARALAQIWEAPSEGGRYLFLDEPVSSLDIHYQHQFLHLARSLVKEKIVLIAVLHDLNLALQYADRIVFMRQGRVVAEGTPDIVTGGLIREVFDIEARLLDDPEGGRPVIVFT
ncbi:MAG: heme ABC transporter ATP-binding protein [Bacteroidetes bacterium]|nr:heme ABC transporter ATP-binding protein [Bacteroidota bacterium]